nr:hypothetical protein [Tanacetum cinerariifolium]
MSSFIKWFCNRIGKKKLRKIDLEGPTFNAIRPFYDNNISLQFQMEECHRMLTDQVDLVNPEGDKGRRSALSISKLKAAHYLDFGLEEVDASHFLFKEDYTIFNKPRVVIYRDRNDQKKMMRETEVHKFSNGTLNRILEKLDHIVKDFKLFKYNPGMTTRIWYEDDRRRSKEFIEVIEHRLKLRRIFKSLDSFVAERLRDVDYILVQRTE